MNSDKETCFEPKIISYSSEGIQTDEIWSQENSVLCESDITSIDLTSSSDSTEYADLSTEKVPYYSMSVEKCNPDSKWLLLKCDDTKLCESFFETYKEFFKEVYGTGTQFRSKDSSTSDVFFNKGENCENLKNKIVDKVNQKPKNNTDVHNSPNLRNHFNIINGKDNILSEEQSEGCLTNIQYSKALQHSDVKYKSIDLFVTENNLKVKLEALTKKHQENEINEVSHHLLELHNDFNNKTLDEQLHTQTNQLKSNFEASIRLKKLEERINKHKINKKLHFSKSEDSSEVLENLHDPFIEIPSYIHIKHVQELNENDANIICQSRIRSCIDFLNISDKGEIYLTPETNISNSLLNNTESCENSFPNKKEIEKSEVYHENSLKTDHRQKEKKINNYLSSNELKNQSVNNNISPDSTDILNSNEPDCLEKKEKGSCEQKKNVFQTNSSNVLDDIRSDSEICQILSQKSINLSDISKIAPTEKLEPEIKCNNIVSTTELTSGGSTHCEFNVRDLSDFHFFYNSDIQDCYDEFTEEFENVDLESTNLITEKISDKNCVNSCDCSLEAIPIYNQFLTMRETTMGPLKGLLKKPNRPPVSRKNRVVFDETKNQFFDADYIILIREDCLYDDEEDTEPCTCGEHELVRICCDEGCCGYTDDGRTPPSPKFAPPIEFVDQATLSPPEGYKDAGGNLIDSALQGALGGHVFGAQHIQQLQVIQRLQQQRAAMLAAKAAAQLTHQSAPNVCVECAECSECAAKQLQEESGSQCSDEVSPCEIPISLGTLIPVTNASPEKRIIEKEIVAGEERPRVLSPKSSQDISDLESKQDSECKPTLPTNKESEGNDSDEGFGLKQNLIGSRSGILKGGRLKKNEPTQVDEASNITSDDESSSKRSVRFTEETKEREAAEGESQTENNPIDYVSHSMKRHSSIFHNALRPNSALRQLFPTTIHSSVISNSLTDDSLKLLDDSTNLNTTDNILSDSDTEIIKKTIERNVLRRSLIKYEPKKKLPSKETTSLEERIRQLTCDIDEPLNESGSFETNMYTSDDSNSIRRDSPTGEETPLQNKNVDKNVSTSSSGGGSLSVSVGSTYKKITDLFNRDKRQDRITENEEGSLGIVPQDCRCPAGPDLGLGSQIQGAHTQIHQPPPPPPRHPDTRRQFLSTLVPLTACVAGQRDDLSYYTLAQPNNRNSVSSSQCTDYSLGDIDKVLTDEESKKVAPDVIAGTPGQETDELVAFALQESIRTEKLKKRYSTENSNPNSDDDDEQNDYGFNKRPQVKGIKSRFSTNEMLQEMQNQLSQNVNHQPQKAQATIQTQTAQTQIVHSSTLPRPHTTMHIAAKQITAHHQHTSSWSYYPDHPVSSNNAQQESHKNYYHLPAHTRHSYHGHEAVAVQETISHQPQNQYGKFARSPTRRPESPPPLRNYHQTMVLIPYNSNPYQQFTSTESESSFGRQHNVVEYQQVTQQTIRVPVGYALPGMQLHVVAPNSHFTTLPRINNGPKNFQLSTPDQPLQNSKFNERGIVRSEPEGAACVQSNDVVLSPTDGKSQSINLSPQVSTGQQKLQSGSVYYAMNV
uniref:CSON005635 protein n=1 Tax=Culicoides sonorensis TaxID=179676 RepID=A0A336LMA7_CULSO